MQYLHTTSNTKPSDHIHNSEILTKCNISSIEAILIKTQLRWSGHLSCMSDSRILKQLLFGQFPTGRSVGKPLLHSKDKLKINLK
uniref:Uncharacterized protein n=1 Tax=Octopus bimaculoides TaxID=37653 RepID=A0A0L8HRK3_OCTBM